MTWHFIIGLRILLAHGLTIILAGQLERGPLSDTQNIYFFWNFKKFLISALVFVFDQLAPFD
ncbi:hypothetical protein KFK09_003515 [Dendrobium nobile]|uniref:Uncharacterized protein n=1 Tax=Dendrobium nobile TaxID=94219 RepID=A0A8T3C3D4_DENNO|nr:hypothetical protein KFK09_003515 [Dendrobium nobile]